MNLYNIDKTKQEGKRLYVPRGNTKNGRGLINEKDVFERLREKGFEWFDPGQQSCEEQLKRFAEAGIFLSVHGSAFVNCIAMSSETTVIELIGKNYCPVHDFILCRQLEIHYKEIDIGNVYDNFGNYKANVGDLVMSLDKILKNL